MELEAIKFIKKNNNWKELLIDKPYCLTIKEDEHYYLLKYNQFDSDFTNPIVQECRGLIVDKETLDAVALSFKKFWEVEVTELADDIDWNSARVQTKCDGSKILVFYNQYKQEWQYTTSSNLNAYEANVNDFGITFGELFEKALENNSYTKESFELNLSRHLCYTFELVAPENRVVVEYTKPDLYFIGCRNCHTFEEIKPTECNDKLGFLIKTPKEYPLTTLEDCIKATEQMTYNEEGYVVVDKNWHRIKIKSPAWKIASHMRFNDISRTKILEIIESSKTEDVLKLYPEYQEYFDCINKKKNAFIEYCLKAYNELREKYIEDAYIKNENKLTRKDYAIWITSNYKDISNFLFNCLNSEDLEPNYADEYIMLNWWNNLDTTKKLKYLENF